VRNIICRQIHFIDTISPKTHLAIRTNLVLFLFDVICEKENIARLESLWCPWGFFVDNTRGCGCIVVVIIALMSKVSSVVVVAAAAPGTMRRRNPTANLGGEISHRVPPHIQRRSSLWKSCIERERD
jgi:hypothetical protein